MASGKIMHPKGELLWSGVFGSGSITVPKAQKYTIFAVRVTGSPVYAFGSMYYGIGGGLGYGALTKDIFGYRFATTVNADSITFTINDYALGGSDSNDSHVDVTEIWGIA